MKLSLLLLITLSGSSLFVEASPIGIDPRSSQWRRSRLRGETNYRRSQVVQEPNSPLHVRKRGSEDELLQVEQDAVVVAKKAKAAAERAKKRLKFRILLGLGTLGLFQTAGWTYVAINSLQNSKENRDAKLHLLEAEKKKPKPNVGDTFCTVSVYYTENQVSTRSPTKVTMPCYRLGEKADNVAAVELTSKDVAGTTSGLPRSGDAGGSDSPYPQTTTVQPDARASDTGIPAAHAQSEPGTIEGGSTVPSQPASSQTGPFSKRGLIADWDPLRPIIRWMRGDKGKVIQGSEEEARRLIGQASSAASSSAEDLGGLMSSGSSARGPPRPDVGGVHAAGPLTDRMRQRKPIGSVEMPELSKQHAPSTVTAPIPYTMSKLPEHLPDPGLAASSPKQLHESFRSTSSEFSEPEDEIKDARERHASTPMPAAASEMHGAAQLEKPVSDTAPAEKAKDGEEDDDDEKNALNTENVLMGMTVLNAVGSIPSLFITMYNSYCCRGNPKLD
ncbi:hypothetical protein BCV70DRAFT_15406 [Testicularia cyperi]|uniref:Transmembrane protein n=1 Tax=Testicularia cyperi TaxID=1882483 RepID=A0A317XYG0_9BASI|nr:hypothetical protein BCV70DRAFT_15406 [Testicularia cyperi]